MIYVILSVYGHLCTAGENSTFNVHVMCQISNSVCKEQTEKMDEQITKTYSRSASNEEYFILSNKSL